MSDMLEDALLNLRSGDPDIREQGLDRVEALRPPNAYEIIGALISDPSPEVRASVASHLGTLGDERAVPLLLQIAATDPDQRTRAYAYEALTAFHDNRILQHLLVSSQDNLPRRIRLAVADNLGNYRDYAAAEVLQRMARSDDDYVCNAAVDALLRQRLDGLVENWIDLLIRGTTNHVTRVAASALQETENTDIFQLIQEQFPTQEDSADYLRTLYALGYIEDQRSIDALSDVVESSRNQDVVEIATLSLSRHNSEKALKALQYTLQKHPISEDTKISIIDTVKSHPSDAARDVLALLSNDQDEHVQTSAARALSRIAAGQGDR